MREAKRKEKRRLKAGTIVEVGEDGEYLKTSKKKNASDADGDADMEEDGDDADASSVVTKDTDGEILVGDSKGMAAADNARVPVVRKTGKKASTVRGAGFKKMKSGGVKQKKK